MPSLSETEDGRECAPLSADEITVRNPSGADATDAARSVRPGLAQGSTVGRFLVLEKLGEGGMGIVYAAYDPSLNRRVALKLLLVGASEGDDRGDARMRLLREAQALAQLSHPGVVAVYEVGEHERDVFIAMEYVEGQTLRDWMRERERPWREVLQVCIQAGHGLAAAHAAGLVHRDFKPANVLVGSDARVRVMDFGLARAASLGETMGNTVDALRRTEASGSRDESVSGPLLHSNVTELGMLVGTPAYMAPEQHIGLEADARSDQYSFCVSVFEALYGERPNRSNPEPTSRTRKIPAWVHAVLERGLQPSPEQRFPSMTALLHALEADPWVRRKKRLTTAAALLLVPVSAAAAGSWQRERQTLCQGAESKLAGVWDAERRAALEATMLATGAVYAADMWTYVRPRLDGYARAWAEQHTRACEDTTLRREHSLEVLDLRMACLHRAKVELQAVVDVLARSDGPALQYAHEVVGELDGLARCEDIEGLRAEVAPPSPEDAEAVDGARRFVAHAAALRHSGSHREAVAALDEAERLLSAVGYGPLKTEVVLEKGEILREAGDYEASMDALQEALGSGALWRQWREMSRAASSLLSLVGNDMQRPREAMHYLELAKGLVHGRGDEAAQAHFHESLGGVLEALGRYEEAEAEQRQALALWERAFGPDHPDVAFSRNNLGNILYAQGKLEEAEAEHRRVLELRQRTLGPDHPHVALSRNNVAGVLSGRGDFEAVEAEFRQALAVFERALGPEHPYVAIAHNNVGIALRAREKWSDAEVEFRTALALWEKLHGPDHPDVSLALDNLASVLAVQGKHDEAEAILRDALARRERALGSDHPAVASSRTTLAIFLLDLQRAAEALPLAEQAWTVQQAQEIPAHQRAEAAFVLARALWETGGSNVRARALAQRALSDYEAAGPGEAENLETVRTWLQRSPALRRSIP